jgi:hypothetical protein
LAWLVKCGVDELKQQESELSSKERELAGFRASGEKQLSIPSLKSETEKLSNKIKEFRNTLLPYQIELSQRDDNDG